MALGMDDLTRIVRELGELSGLEKSVEHVTTSARWLFGADAAGILLIRSRGRLETVGPTDEIAAKADLLQQELGEGPCVEAATEERLVISHDVVSDPRWPRWGPAIAGLGIRSAAAVDLMNGQTRLGALNLFGRRHEQFAFLEPVELRGFAVHVTEALAAAQRIESLQIALESRTVIAQAEGILMERFSIDAVTAFAVLRRASQDGNVKVRELAEQLVNHGDISAIVGNGDVS